MRRFAVGLALMAVAVGGASPVAIAGGSKRTRHRVDVTLHIALVSSQGQRRIDAALVNGTQGAGALIERDVVKGATFRGKSAIYYVSGMLHAKTKGRVGTGSGGVVILFGSGTFTGGTGTYRGATGRYTFTVSVPAGQNVGVGHVVGALSY